MASKVKANKGKQAADNRYGDITVAQLKASAESLRAVAARFDAVIEVMTRSKIASVRTDGATKLSRGTEMLELFAKNVRKGLVDANAD